MAHPLQGRPMRLTRLRHTRKDPTRCRYDGGLMRCKASCGRQTAPMQLSRSTRPLKRFDFRLGSLLHAVVEQQTTAGQVISMVLCLGKEVDPPAVGKAEGQRPPQALEYPGTVWREFEPEG